MEKNDYRKELKHLYAPSSKNVDVVDVPEMNFLMVDGQGDPSTSGEYQAAVEGLFTLSYTLKFMIKKASPPVDYAVFPLEGLWWADDLSAFTTADRKEWKWTAMIAQPASVSEELLQDALREAAKKKKLLPGGIRLERFSEGPAAQIMYVGPFAQEGPTITRIHRYIADMGWRLAGKHHEIYLSDFRRTPSEKLRTVIRQPFTRNA